MLRVEEDAVRATIAGIARVLGEDRVLTGTDVLRQHGTDESWHPPATPDAVVLPRDTEEAAKIVRACREHKVPLVPSKLGHFILAAYDGTFPTGTVTATARMRDGRTVTRGVYVG